MKIERLYIPVEFKRYVKHRNSETLTEEAVEFDTNQHRQQRQQSNPNDETAHQRDKGSETDSSPKEQILKDGTIEKRVDIVA